MNKAFCHSGARVTLVEHSGVLVELESIQLAWDLMSDPVGCLERIAEDDRPLLYFVSHEHGDHWNPMILEQKHKGIQGWILEQDVERQARSLLDPARARRVQVANAGQEIACSDWQRQAGIQRIWAGDSTDLGVSYALELTSPDRDRVVLYHAGDLNDWDWQDEDTPAMRRAYQEAIKNWAKRLAPVQGISPKAEGRDSAKANAYWVNLACLPVDHRLGSRALAGALEWIRTIPTQFVLPIHLFGDPTLPEQLRAAVEAEAERLPYKPEILSLTESGASIKLSF